MANQIVVSKPDNTSPTTSRGFPTSLSQSKSTEFTPVPKNIRGAEDDGRPGKRPRLEGMQPMTAAAAFAGDGKTQSEKDPVTTSPITAQTSPNPQAEALGALMGITQLPTTKADDLKQKSPRTNAATTLSQPMTVVAENLQQPGSDAVTNTSDSQNLTSPVSLSSLGTLDSISAPSAIVGHTVSSPQPMDAPPRPSGTSGESVSPSDNNKAFSYPAPLLQPSTGDRRGMSLPHSGSRQGTRSPSSKKHKCPYCNTEFTRHHNLKSHLLTHSQEKPYVCSTCNSRFRRLHDLKRHTKLHTGERPHICPKCNRKFARGDALARHNKGPGGCAGRRASMGSFGGDDDLDGADDMDGVVYGEPEAMEDDDGNPRGPPQIRRQAPSGDDSIDDPQHNYRIPSTYPPIQGRPPAGMNSGPYQPRSGFGPPPPMQVPSQGQSSVGYGSSGSSSNLRPGQTSQVFSHNPMTESPGPLSPQQRKNTGTGPIDGNLHRTRSPTNPQFAQQTSYPPPRGSSGSSSLTVPPHAPQLPPPHVLNAPDPRFTLPSQGPTHPPTGPSGPPTHMSGSGPLSSHSNSSGHGQSGHGSGEGHKNTFPTNEERLWAVVHSMEQQMRNMSDTISALRDEVNSLRNIVNQQQRT